MSTKPKSLSAIHLAAAKRIQAENAALRYKVESLEARTTELAQELDDWRNREAACCPEDTHFEDEIKALRAKTESLEAEVNKREQQIADFARRTWDEMECLQAKLWALEGAARDAFMEGFILGHGRGQDWASTGSVKKYAENGWEYSDAKEKLEKAEPNPTKGEEATAPGVVEALQYLDAALLAPDLREPIHREYYEQMAGSWVGFKDWCIRKAKSALKTNRRRNERGAESGGCGILREARS